ncbi:MAG: zf-HC2 domain-containing protein [Nitrospira sp.]
MVHDPPEQTASEITCREVAEWTSAYLDERVNDTSKIRMALHLATCTGCEAYVKQIASVRDMLGLLPMAVTEPAQHDRLRQAFSARRNQPSSTKEA